MQGPGLAGLEEIHRRLALAGPVVVTGFQPHVQDPAKFLGGERCEGLEGDGEAGADLERGVEDRGGPVHVGLGHLPGLRV